MTLERSTWLRRSVETAYVVAIAGLTLLATRNPNDFRPRVWVAALVLTLPAMVAMLPVLYLLAALAWNITGADTGGVTWPVTTTYVFVLTAAAVLNVVLFRIVTNRRQRTSL